MAAVGFSFPTIDARSSPILQISGINSLLSAFPAIWFSCEECVDLHAKLTIDVTCYEDRLMIG